MDGHCQTGSVYIFYVPSKDGFGGRKVMGSFINDVNISWGVSIVMTHNCIKVVTWGRKGVKKSGKIGDIIYGRPLNVVLFCIIIHI